MANTTKTLVFWGTVLVAAVTVYTYTSAGVPDPPVVSSGVPAKVSCADAQGLRQHATDDRRQVDAVRSDHQKIVLGSRANFFASLAVIADFTCRATLPGLDARLKPAFEAARRADETKSAYEKARKWSEADFIATEVITAFVQQMSK
jgi:hypothetical protein